MKNSSIKNIKELRLAKAETKANIINQEVEISASIEELKSSFFSLSGIASGLKIPFLKGFPGKPTHLLAHGISRFFVKKVLQPESKFLKKAEIFFSTIAVDQIINFVGRKLGQNQKKLS